MERLLCRRIGIQNRARLAFPAPGEENGIHGNCYVDFIPGTENNETRIDIGGQYECFRKCFWAEITEKSARDALEARCRSLGVDPKDKPLDYGLQRCNGSEFGR